MSDELLFDPEGGTPKKGRVFLPAALVVSIVGVAIMGTMACVKIDSRVTATEKDIQSNTQDDKERAEKLEQALLRMDSKLDAIQQTLMERDR